MPAGSPPAKALLGALLAACLAAFAAPTGAETAAESEDQTRWPECPSALIRHLSPPLVRRTCKKAQKTFERTVLVEGACRYVFRPEESEEEADTAKLPFVEIRETSQPEPPSRPEDTFYSWRKVGKAYVTYKANTARAQPWFDTATTLWLADETTVVTVTVATALCTRAEADRLAKALR